MSNLTEITIPDIEKEFKRLWKAAEAKKQVKASLFTLVIYASESNRAKYLQDFIDTILSKFPCRLIFIQADLDTDKSFFNVAVSTVMSGNIEHKSTIACDQILIKASKDQLFRAPYLIIPHLIADLPVFLLWGQNPYEENVIFPALQPFSTRIIFNAEASKNLNLFCREMLTGINTLGIDLMDINWALISNWRDMLRQLFLGPEMIEQLNHCKSVIITYNDAKDGTATESERLQHPEIRAIYLQGWLSACLKWRFRSLEIFQTSTIINYFGGKNPVVVALSPEYNPDLPIGAITSMEFTTTDGTTHQAIRKEKLSQVIVHTTTKNECLLPYPLPLPSAHRGMNFMQEIFYNTTGDHYEEMLVAISHLDFDLIKSRIL